MSGKDTSDSDIIFILFNIGQNDMDYLFYVSLAWLFFISISHMGVLLQRPQELVGPMHTPGQ